MQENLSSTTTRKEEPGSGRSSVTVEDTAVIVKEVDEMLELMKG